MISKNSKRMHCTWKKSQFAKNVCIFQQYDRIHITYMNILLLIKFLYNDHFLNMRNERLIQKIIKGKYKWM